MNDDICSGRLADTVAIVTGSTRGIGRGIARRFAREGATVVVNDDGTHDGSAVAAEIESVADAGRVRYVEADVRDPDAVQTLIDRTISEFGRLDILVNNVGEGRNDHPRDVTLEAWDYVMETSLRSGWLCVKHGLEHLSGGGSVINISSAHAHATTPGYFPYNVAKAGVNGLTRALAVELADIDVRVNAISPGAIVVDEREPSAERLRQEPRTDPVGRMGAPEDIAAMAAYLASDESEYITGTVLHADGGRNAVQRTTPDNR